MSVVRGPPVAESVDEAIDSERNVCAICLSLVTTGPTKGDQGKPCRLPCDCELYYHSQCIALWLCRRNSCPQCRSMPRLPEGVGMTKDDALAVLPRAARQHHIEHLVLLSTSTLSELLHPEATPPSTLSASTDYIDCRDPYACNPCATSDTPNGNARNAGTGPHRADGSTAPTAEEVAGAGSAAAGASGSWWEGPSGTEETDSESLTCSARPPRYIASVLPTTAEARPHVEQASPFLSGALRQAGVVTSSAAQSLGAEEQPQGERMGSGLTVHLPTPPQQRDSGGGGGQRPGPEQGESMSQSSPGAMAVRQETEEAAWRVLPRGWHLNQLAHYSDTAHRGPAAAAKRDTGMESDLDVALQQLGFPELLEGAEACGTGASAIEKAADAPRALSWSSSGGLDIEQLPVMYVAAASPPPPPLPPATVVTTGAADAPGDAQAAPQAAAGAAAPLEGAAAAARSGPGIGLDSTGSAGDVEACMTLAERQQPRLNQTTLPFQEAWYRLRYAGKVVDVKLHLLEELSSAQVAQLCQGERWSSRRARHQIRAQLPDEEYWYKLHNGVLVTAEYRKVGSRRRHEPSQSTSGPLTPAAPAAAATAATSGRGGRARLDAVVVEVSGTSSSQEHLQEQRARVTPRWAWNMGSCLLVTLLPVLVFYIINYVVR